MNKLFLLSVIVVLATVSAQSPSFCNDLNCPKYTTLYSNASASFEIRKYEPAFWVRTNLTNLSYDDAGSAGFEKLFAYISGANQGQQSVDMTSPVTIKIIPGQGPACKTTFIVSFFIPFKYQAANNPPPAPTDPAVYIEKAPAATYGIVYFPGWASTWDEVTPQILSLANILSARGAQFVQNIESVAQYDSPFQLFDRHNEIWIELL